jgi:hypothetical protein
MIGSVDLVFRWRPGYADGQGGNGFHALKNVGGLAAA